MPVVVAQTPFLVLCVALLGLFAVDGALAASLRVSTSRRATGDTKAYPPTVATFVDSDNPYNSYRNSADIQVDSRPDTMMAYLRFENLPARSDVEKVELALQCTDTAPSGGVVHKGSAAVTPYVSWNTRPNERYQIFTRLAEIGTVRKGRTYLVDISRVIKEDGRLESALNLVIVPDSGNGAAYSKKEIQLVVTFAPPQVRTGPLQIMLYFEPFYLWQGSSARRSFCVDCSRRSWRKSRSDCDRGDYVQVQECDDDNERQWWIYDTGRFRSYTDNGLCWDYAHPYYRLERCGSSGTQTFASGPAPASFNVNGNFESQRFELYPKEKRNKCVTQNHHPKKGEKLKSQRCFTARKHDTSYWVATAPPRWSGHSLDN